MPDDDKMSHEFYGGAVAAEQVINRLLSLPATGKEQDWEHEFAGRSRIEEMLALLSQHSFNDDKHCALVPLVIASIDETRRLKLKPSCATASAQL